MLQEPEPNAEVLDAFSEAVAEGVSWQAEVVNYRKDRTPYIVDWNAAPVTGGEGDVKYWVSIQRDVTDARRMWERLLEV